MAKRFPSFTSPNESRIENSFVWSGKMDGEKITLDEGHKYLNMALFLLVKGVVTKKYSFWLDTVARVALFLAVNGADARSVIEGRFNIRDAFVQRPYDPELLKMFKREAKKVFSEYTGLLDLIAVRGRVRIVVNDASALRKKLAESLEKKIIGSNLL